MIEVKSRISIFALSLLLLGIACVGTTKPQAPAVTDSAGPAPVAAQQSAQEIVQAAKAVVERAVSTAVPADQGARAAAAQTSNAAPPPAPEPAPLKEPAAELKSTRVSLSFDAGESRQLLSPQNAVVLMSPDGRVQISARPGSVSEPVVLAYSDVDVAELPELPEGFVAGSRAFDLDAFGTDGTEIEDFAFQDSVSVTVPITIGDLRIADIDPFKITLQHFKKGQWSTLPRSFNLDDLTLTVSVSSLSTFALLIELAEPATNEAAPVARAQFPDPPQADSAPSVTAPTETPPPNPLQADAAIQEEPTAAPAAPSPVAATVSSTEGAVLARGAASLSAIRTTIGEGPELVLVESKKKVRHGSTFGIRVGAFDKDDDLSKLYMIDGDRRIVDEASCLGGICLHTFEVTAPLTYETPFELYFVAVDSEGSESPLLTVKSETRKNPFSGATAKVTEPVPIFPLTINGSNGTSVTFDAPPERIVAYDSEAVEILFDIGEGSRIVGVHDFVTFPPQVKDIPKVGSSFVVNVEVLSSLDPDFVFFFFAPSPDTLDLLEDLGLSVLVKRSEFNDFEATSGKIRMWGDITGNPSAADELVEEFEDGIEEIEDIMASQPDGPRVFYSVGGLFTLGSDSLIGAVLELLKLQNIASEIVGFDLLAEDIFIERDPQVILVASDADPDFFPENYSSVTAVKDGMVFQTAEVLNIGGARLVEGIKDVAEQVYPGLFP